MDNQKIFSILEFLQQFRDNEFHEIENIFGEDNSFRKDKEFKNSVMFLIKNKSIIIDEGTGNEDNSIIGIRYYGEHRLLHPRKEFVYKPLQAKITIEGIQLSQTLRQHFNTGSKKRRKPIPQIIRAKLQKENNSKCPFCPNGEVGHFEVHHIDENPENNNIENLISLCAICHSKIHKGEISKELVSQTKERMILNQFHTPDSPQLN